MTNFFRRLLFDEDGPTAVEYAVLLALIVIACLGSVQALATATGASLNSSAGQLAGAFGS